MFVADLLRHGELKGGVKYRGHIEEDLTEAGLCQMNHVWQHIRHDIDVIITSPLSRCALPAQQWAKEHAIPCIIDERIVEMNYGEWEGMSHEEIETFFPGSLNQWRNDPTGMRPPKGESPEELQARIINFWDDACQTYQNKHALIVAHSGSTRMLIAHIQKQPISYTRNIAMPYACWSRAKHKDHQSNMVFINNPVPPSNVL